MRAVVLVLFTMMEAPLSWASPSGGVASKLHKLHSNQTAPTHHYHRTQYLWDPELSDAELIFLARWHQQPARCSHKHFVRMVSAKMIQLLTCKRTRAKMIQS
jgi:hypothetical protein